MANISSRLNPAIWPATARTEGKSGELSLGGISVTELVARFGTPVFVLDETDFRARAVKFRDAVKEIFGATARFITQAKHLPL